MASLQICRLVALVTSKNRSEVVFLILKRNQRDFRESNQKWTPATPTVIRRKPSETVSRKPRASPMDRHTLERRAQGDGQGRAGGDAVAAARSTSTPPTFVFSLLVIGGKEMTSPSASTRQGYRS